MVNYQAIISDNKVAQATGEALAYNVVDGLGAEVTRSEAPVTKMMEAIVAEIVIKDAITELWAIREWGSPADFDPEVLRKMIVER